MIENVEKDWTIMVYMAGDNNLSIDMVYALEQIKSAADQNDNINLLVYFDGYSSSVPTLYCDFTDCNSINYYRSSNVKDKLIKSDSDFNENSASINNVINFVDWCVNKVEYKSDKKSFRGRKAKNYAMIFSGHSFGFQSEGLFKDEKANYSMNLPRLKWMFERITKPQAELDKLAELEQNWDDQNWDAQKIKERTTEVIGKPLTLLGFDSCVMSMLEIGCQFREIAETMVASEGSIPNAGWSYAQILLGKISQDRKASAREIAAGFVEDFVRQQNKYALADISVDMAAWDFRVLGELEKSFAGFVQILDECFANPESVSYKQLKRILLQVHWQCQPYMYQQNIDLGDFCQLLLDEISSLKTELHLETIQPILKLEATCREVLDKIRNCIILTGFSGGKYQYSNGISLFFPWSWSSYSASQSSYEALFFVKKNDAGKLWNQFLKKYLRDISRRQAKPLSSINPEGSLRKNSDGSIVYQSYQYISQINGEISGGIFADTKIPENGTEKIPENGTEKIPENGTEKIPENGTEKIPENGTEKIPENGTEKLVGAFGDFFSKFLETRNVESHWNRSGFISNQVEFMLEPEKSSIKNLSADISSVTENIVLKILPCQNGNEKNDETKNDYQNSFAGTLDSKSVIEAVKHPKKKKKAKKK